MKKLIIDAGAIRSNLAAVRKMTGSALLMADLSCDAHGLGLMPAASILRDEGVRAFAVGEVEDAERLRRGGFVDQQILILRSTVDASEIERACDAGAICTVGSLEAGIAASSAAQARSTVIEVRLKVDSGPGQYGFLPSELDKMMQVYQRLPNLAVSGIYTRLPGARAGKKVILQRMEAFESLLVKLDDAGIDLGVTQALDSYSLFKCDLDVLDAVCVGSALTGRTPGLGNQLTKVGCIEAAIDELKWLPADTVVGEGKGKKLKKSTKAAVVPVGWFNGVGRPAPGSGNPFARLLARFFGRGDRVTVTRDGKRLRLLGPVCEDYLLLDVTELDCGVGDVVCIEADPRTVKGISVEYRT
jgi:alanine racemase